ncbi:hypothetical protein G3I44_14375 [Halogeometricum borinquense]|uniref:Uncharacterized protein n=1 Tax=Halogeometricum borinquense TaxID=60847 RepID=A0A6C0UIQ7_9EURY|nr:hypothetical protein [Halogeometricum borinquense]QIB75372.1 hypothetical protein G3I44_14375 [Halogeometricum borinquense]
MGFSSKQVLGIVALVVVGMVSTGFVMSGASVGDVLPFSSAAQNQQPTTQPAPGQSSDTETVMVNDWGVDAKVTLPTTITKGDVYLFEEKPDADRPVNYANYVDFDISEATSGLTDGRDYYKENASGASSVTFNDLDSGTYYLVLVDESASRDYHNLYAEVTMPEEVGLAFAEQDKDVKLATQKDFTLFPTYGTDNTVITNAEGDFQTTGDNLDNPSTNGTRERIVEREMEVDTGSAYLGKLVAENFNDDDGIEEMYITVEADGKTLYDQQVVDGSDSDFGSDNALTEDLADAIDTDPETSSSTITLTVDVVYTANTLSGSADDSKIGTSESIVDLWVEDIYGNKVGDASKTQIVG